MCLPIVTCQPYMPVARMEWLEHHQWDDLMAPVAKNLLRRISHVCQHNWKWHLKLVLSCATWQILNHKYPVIALAGPPPLSVLSSVIPLKLHYCDKEKRQTILQKIQPDVPGLTGVFSNPEYSKISCISKQLMSGWHPIIAFWNRFHKHILITSHLFCTLWNMVSKVCTTKGGI